MLSRVRFHLRRRRSRFAEALALLEPGDWPRTGWQQWAGYRLGLYASVAESRWDGRHVHGGMAVAVAQAACGRVEEAAVLARRLAALDASAPWRVQLADALAPFVPALALELLEKEEAAPLSLHAALLLCTGDRQQAARLLQEAIDAGAAVAQPELRLLAANAGGGEPAQQLERLNAFLASFVLPPLALRDPVLPPSPSNLTPAAAPAPVRGPLVSVLMTAYQTADRIGTALAGLLAQSYRDLEVIVVDDASTDGTGEAVRAWAARDGRVKYLRLPCNVGTYVAKTVALHQAAGEFVTCHDSDDWSHPLRIERQVAPLLRDPRLVATTSHWVRMQDDGLYYARSVHPLVRLNPASPMFRREKVLRLAGAWDAVRTGADSEFAARLRLAFGRSSVHRVAQPLTFGAHRPNSLMTAADTGYGAGGMSPVRLAYWESWTRWHIAELRAGRRPAMPADLLAPRPFAAPGDIEVPSRDIETCFALARSWSAR